MRWWVKALIFSVIFSVIWVGVVGAVMSYHTGSLAGQITPAQVDAMARKYADLASNALPLVWVICFLVLWLRHRRRSVSGL